MLLTGIIFIFVAPIIYIKSPGPIFFKQVRIGKNGKKIQHLQIPKHVYGCRGTKERTDETERDEGAQCSRWRMTQESSEAERMEASMGLWLVYP